MTEQIKDALSALRPTAVLDERELADMVAGALAQNGIGFTREAMAGKGCRVDFLLENGLAIEVKARRHPRSVLLKQLGRYAACEGVRAVLLVTSEAARLPASLCGKPLGVLCLKSLWGVAL